MDKASKREASVLVSPEHGVANGAEHGAAVCATMNRENDRATVVHSTAVVASDVSLGSGVQLGANVYVAEGAVIGERTMIEAGTFIGQDCRIGRDCRISAGVTIRERTLVGDRVCVEAGTVIGSDGFGFAFCTDGNKMKMPQVGHVVVGNDSVIGSNAAIDRGTLGATELGQRVRIGPLSQVAHNCRIGDDAIIGAHSGICGSSEIQERVRLGASVGVIGHICVGHDAVVRDGSGVTRSIKPGQIVGGYPAQPVERQDRMIAALCRLPELVERIQELEKRLE